MKTALPSVDVSDYMPSRYTGPPAVPGVVWHYTTGLRSKKIVAAGVLLPHGTPPILWFSKHHVWEPCASRASVTSQWANAPQAVTFDELQQWGTRLVRFSVPEALAPYGHWQACARAGMKTHVAQQAAYAGTRVGGKVDDWRASLVPIVQADWLSIEIWHVDHWRLAWEP